MILKQARLHHAWITGSLLVRVALKGLFLFTLLNVAFAALQPLPFLGRLSLYNILLPGRLRLPYGDNPAADYSLTLNNLPAMFASHKISQPKVAGEFRVVVIGDSAVWGWLLENDGTLAGQLSEQWQVASGKWQVAVNHSSLSTHVAVYNLGYPVLSLTKDLLLLEASLQYRPDLIIWPVTLHSFARERQLDHPLLQQNPAAVSDLITRHSLNLDPEDPRFVEPNFWESTIAGQRSAMADLLRLQFYGFSWAATGIDQDIPTAFTPRQSDFEPDVSWLDYNEPTPLTAENLTLDVLAAGIEAAGDVPVLIVNEPIFVSDGRNSDLRYNAFYPRWAYDAYRELLAETAAVAGWSYVDLWDIIPRDEFTDTPVHLTPEGNRQLAERICRTILYSIL
jgi:hypothetical protein